MDPDDEEAQMAALMGFKGFGTTKQKKVRGNNAGAIAKNKTAEYRQYMYVTLNGQWKKWLVADEWCWTGIDPVGLIGLCRRRDGARRVGLEHTIHRTYFGVCMVESVGFTLFIFLADMNFVTRHTVSLAVLLPLAVEQMPRLSFGQKYTIQARQRIAALRKARPDIAIEVRWCPVDRGPGQ